MEDKKISQRALAMRLGLSVQAVNMWCAGKNYPECDMLLKLAEFFGESADYLLTGIRPENKKVIDDLGLSDEAIERLKYMHSDKEIDEKLMPFVNVLLSDRRFYSTFWRAIHALITESGYFIARFANANEIELTAMERLHPEIVGAGLRFATGHCYSSMADFFRSFFRENTDIEKAESLYEKIKSRLFDDKAGNDDLIL